MRLCEVLTCALLAASIAAADAHAAPEPYPQWPVRLQTEVLKGYRNFDGELHLYVKDLKTGVEYGHNDSTRTYIASGVKVMFMIELFRQVEAGLVTLDDTMTYERGDLRDGAPLFNYLPTGTKLSVRILLEAMIQQSDNAASDMVARKVGMDNVNRMIDAFGFEGFGEITSLLDVRRRVYREIDGRIDALSPKQIRSLGFARGAEARALKLADILREPPGTFTPSDIERGYRRYYASGANSASMRAFGAVLEGLALGKVVSSSASKAMIELMAGTQTGVRRVTSQLPPEVKVAHKTGTQYRRTCDLAVLYLAEDHPVVYAACAKGSRGGKREAFIARIAAKTYKLLRGKNLEETITKLPKKSRRRRGKRKKRPRSDSRIGTP